MTASKVEVEEGITRLAEVLERENIEPSWLADQVKVTDINLLKWLRTPGAEPAYPLRKQIFDILNSRKVLWANAAGYRELSPHTMFGAPNGGARAEGFEPLVFKILEIDLFNDHGVNILSKIRKVAVDKTLSQLEAEVKKEFAEHRVARKRRAKKDDGGPVLDYKGNPMIETVKDEDGNPVMDAPYEGMRFTVSFPLDDRKRAEQQRQTKEDW